LYAPQDSPRNYLAFIGRIAPEKRPDRAIEIARRCGVELRIAAKVDRVDEDYFQQRIAPMLRHPGVRLIGEIGDTEKRGFLVQARALLFPIDWPEPFGLVMLEAMACGTPTIAFRCGSVPEVLEEGVTGYIVDSIEEAVAVVERLDGFDRARCRAVFEGRFTAERMARNYVEIYRTLCEPSRQRLSEVPVAALGG
jgi:glycosyltransferase involved in cell wall biosynthesis